ncbi:hypothetical protein WJX79_002810 [Trebouxia sp. C0005]
MAGRYITGSVPHNMASIPHDQWCWLGNLYLCSNMLPSCILEVPLYQGVAQLSCTGVLLTEAKVCSWQF